MLMAASPRPVPHTNHSAHLMEIWNNSQTTVATAIRYLIYKHSSFLRHKVIRTLPNATVL